jgi:hypothetical protein
MSIAGQLRVVGAILALVLYGLSANTRGQQAELGAGLPEPSKAKVAPSGIAPSQPADGPSVDFARDIRPILEERCYSCHGPEKQKSGLRLDRKASALKGGESGPVIQPGKSAESKLIQLVSGADPEKVMPAKGPRLTVQQVTLLRAWIDQGAVWEEELFAAVKRARTPSWALQPLQRPELPKVRRRSWARNPIDLFVLARLEQTGLEPAPEADRATLLRRLTFDFLGLPPNPEEMAAFLSDPGEDAYERLVEKLLAAPQYGERWGRHWLDVARYTESQGFEYDHMRENAWHYRDYVIASLNEDKPYDVFVREQIAGDVLKPISSQSIIATSLLVCGAWDQAGSSQANVTQRLMTREEELEDLISVVGQSFLGLSINCARCHSHKFDPIPQEDYYRIKSVFEGVRHGERSILSPEQVEARSKTAAELKVTLLDAEDQLEEIESPARRQALVWKARPEGQTPGMPRPMARWDFQRGLNDTVGTLNAELRKGAILSSRGLHLDGQGAFAQTGPIPKDVTEKTLEVWLSLANIDQGGGGAISIETPDGSAFDAIVFGERQERQWMAGSEFYRRSRNLDAPDEGLSMGEWIQVAIVYRPDNSIAVYRNGKPYGAVYTPKDDPRAFKTGEAHLLFGKRHTGGSKGFLEADVARACFYDRALSADEVAACFAVSDLRVSEEALRAVLTSSALTRREKLHAEIVRLSHRLKDLRIPPMSYAGVRQQPEPTHRLKRGDVRTPLEIVRPGALSAVTSIESDFGLPENAPEELRRKAFAHWLTDRRNPLTPRVMANRLWHYHFGQGIVATPNDLGVSGAKPSHPELLDWLACELLDRGWRLKDIQRLIVCSATYRQASFSARAEVETEGAKGVAPGPPLDADNQLLWHFTPRRLEAEALHDAMLAVSGDLNLTEGGPSFRPFDTKEFNATFYSPKDKLGPEFNRRTVYRMNINSGKDPMLDAFDCPDPSVKTPKRGVTTTPLQALSLMNNSFVQRQAERLAQRVTRESQGDLRAAIALAYRYCFGREALPRELARADTVATEHGLQTVCWAMLNSTEFLYVN